MISYNVFEIISKDKTLLTASIVLFVSIAINMITSIIGLYTTSVGTTIVLGITFVSIFYSCLMFINTRIELIKHTMMLIEFTYGAIVISILIAFASQCSKSTLIFFSCGLCSIFSFPIIFFLTILCGPTHYTLEQKKCTTSES